MPRLHMKSTACCLHVCLNIIFMFKYAGSSLQELITEPMCEINV